MTKIDRWRTDSAVSPVVGVLLMLVVTIIIAAVVSGFAGGLVENEEKTPQVSLEVSYTKGSWGDEMVIRHMSGDPLNTKNVQLITSWSNSSGITNYQKIVAPIYVVDNETYIPGHTCHYALDSLNTHYVDYMGDERYYNAPYKIVPGDAPADGVNLETELWWGNYVMKAGDVIKAQSNLDSSNTATPIVKNFQSLTGNDLISVKLIDSASGGTIFEKNVYVAE